MTLSNTPEKFIIAGLLLLSAFVHGFNMFHFPYYENDEAVYISQAWAVTTDGDLAPYTYWYDHAPGGWFLIAAWAKLTGGYFTFGNSINTGRVLILVLHVLSTWLLYTIAKRLSGSRFAAVVAALIFSLSPLGIYFQRRVLLDNIMVFWCLLSIFFLLSKTYKLRYVFLSAVCFAFACVSKETAVFFLPAYVYLVWVTTRPGRRLVPLLSWLVLAGVIISIYPLYALLKGELFAYGSMLGGMHPHVSLIETLQFQGSRPGGSVFHPADSLFWQNMARWSENDFFIIFFGVVSIFVNAWYWFRKRAALTGFSVLLSIFSFLFLMRGGVVIEFYVIPMIPILALSLGIAAEHLVHYLRTVRLPLPYLKLAAIVLLLGGYTIFAHDYQGLNLYTADQVAPQLAALEWIRTHAEPDDYIITDNYLWLDLNAPENPSGKVFQNAEWYWKTERDPEIKFDLLHNDPDRIDYLVVTPQVVIDTRTSDFKLMANTLEQSKIITAFDGSNWSVEIWGNRAPEKVLKRSWNDYKARFISSDGMVKDLERPTTFTSQAQSYALLKAVWMNDKETYDKVLEPTLKTFQYENGTFRGVYNPEDTSLVSFTDADEDIALSLIFAAKQWNQPSYAEAARKVLEGIWTQDVAIVRGVPYASAGNWAEHAGGVTLNPSFLSPATYRIFAQFDQSHPWNDLVASSYDVLERCTNSSLGTTGGVLPADWCDIKTATGVITQSNPPQPISTDYSIDAYRVPWRIALDYEWFESAEAKTYLETLSFLEHEYTKEKLLYASYQHNGTPRDLYESTAMYAGSLGYFVVTDPILATDIYNKKIAAKFYENAAASYWDVADNYYTQNWAWFGTALYSGQLKNIYTD